MSEFYLQFSIERAIKKMLDRGHPKLFWAIDVHDTIFPSTYEEEKKFSMNLYALQFLQYLSKTDRHEIILWTSTWTWDVSDYLTVLAENGIDVKYVNVNPECENTSFADFSLKMYFDIIIDDKAGFDQTRHWLELCKMIPIIEERMKGI